MRATVRVSAMVLWSVVIGGSLFGCKDAEVQTSTVNVSTDLNACLGAAEAAGQANSCRAGIDEAIAATPVNACMVVQRSRTPADAGVGGGADTRTFRRGLRWADGTLTEVAGGDLVDLGPGDRYQAAIFLLAEGSGGADVSVCDAFSAEGECGAGCVLRLTDDELLKAEDSTIDFKSDEGVCNVAWGPAATPVEVCDGVDNDCDGLIDAADTIDGRPIQCGEDCQNDADCADNAGKFCVANTCQACAPADGAEHAAHDGCGANELCCAGDAGTHACQATDPASQCAGCGIACNGTAADTCADRACVCGDGDAACGDDTGLCLAGECVQCDPAANGAPEEGDPQVDSNPRCDAGTLCCNNTCVDQAQDRCGACGTACTFTNNRCDAGTCRCGGTANCEGACDEVSADPTEAICRECQADGDCRNAERPFCVGSVCQACDEGADLATIERACNEVSATPICQDGACRTCRDDLECQARPGRLDFCNGGPCQECSTNSGDGCTEASPICDGGTCRPCAADNECPGDAAVCVGGQCRGCNPNTHDGCGMPPDRPFCDAITRICRACGTNEECEAATQDGRDVCIRDTGRCEACNLETHEGCGLDSLCCAGADGVPTCVPTDLNGGCEACGQGCDLDYANACTDRACECGPSSRGCTPDGGGVTGERCSDDLGCVECRDNDDCGIDFQCCDGSCQPTGGGLNDICTGCGLGANSCNQATTDRCTARECACGGGAECNGDTPVCEDGESCVQCLLDAHCVANGFDGQQCVGKNCRECDPNAAGGQPAHIGCAEDGARPICDGGDCRRCALDGNRNVIGDAECALRPGERNQCVGGECADCDPANNDGCERGAPICDDASRTCRACVRDNECPAGQLCVGGQCDLCDPQNSADTCGGASPVCDDSRRCRACTNNRDCRDAGLDGVCTPDGRCVECNLADHEGCANDELCCGALGQQTCVPATMEQCSACGVACDGDSTNRCDNRVCECGNHNPSICAGFEPFCAGNGNAGECVACEQDAQCVLPGRRECVGTGNALEAFCEVCDPADNAGCNNRSNQPFCKRNGDVVACSACANDTECDGLGGQCVASGACKTCDPADDAGCVPGSAAPICGDDFACRVCRNDVECGANPRAGDLCHVATGLCYDCEDGRRTGDETDADCGGRCARDFDLRCANNLGCAAGTDCQSGVCTGGRCSPPACDDAVRNGTETDVDCGGDVCGACGTALRCNDNGDCQSSNCVGGRCAAPTCDDGIFNQDETDVDCGGARCTPCANNRRCDAPGDCVSGVCGGDGRCAAPTCADTVLNGAETDQDCGGAVCPACANALICQADRDCTSGVCRNQRCQAPSCSDQVLNQNETGVDCGGPCRALNQLCPGGVGCAVDGDCITGTCDNGTCNADSCGNGAWDQAAGETDQDCGGPCGATCLEGNRCLLAADCVTRVCNNNICQAARCDDMVRNGDETDLDCGGGGANNCARCAPGGACSDGPRDCTSFICDAQSLCTAPTCDDGVRNQDETGVDCAGSCPTLCPPGQGCGNDGDCAEGVCSNGTCAQPTCADATQNQQESDIDCGGPNCRAQAPCPVGDACLVPGDCAEGVCDGGTCAAPTCVDGVQNGDETDVDCGGDTCGPCDDGAGCGVPGDCTSSVCTGGTCQAPRCDDTVRNGTETGIDCGGPACGACPAGQACNANEDCQSSVCTGLICQAPTCADQTQNGVETDIDCGGAVCRASDDLCAPGQTCNAAADCASGVCTGNQCAAPACDDGTKNGDETGVDCGGTCPNACPAGQGCNLDAECVSLVCTNNLCQQARCNDGVQNGGESDVDCGGPCNGCGRGEQCGDAGDCANNVSHCVGGTCQSCDPNNHSGCLNRQLCCLGGGGVNFTCQNTSVDGQCSACAVACNLDRADNCSTRSCKCGNEAECPDSYCLGGVCGAVCLRDEHCAGSLDGTICDGALGTCGCTNDGDCPMGRTCDGTTCQGN